MVCVFMKCSVYIDTTAVPFLYMWVSHMINQSIYVHTLSVLRGVAREKLSSFLQHNLLAIVIELFP